MIRPYPPELKSLASLRGVGTWKRREVPQVDDDDEDDCVDGWGVDTR
jgi:hypothetical protein